MSRSSLSLMTTSVASGPSATSWETENIAPCWRGLVRSALDHFDERIVCLAWGVKRVADSTVYQAIPTSKEQ